ncbi:MAG: type II toxin-antitoxin system PemK/MazF family toxin [Candidatus Woesearchaeota archaeon]
MEGLVKGDVVILEFPFTNLAGKKRRPALVLAVLPYDILVCAITTTVHPRDVFVPLLSEDFKDGRLPVPCVVKPLKMFTADRSIVLVRRGRVNDRLFENVVDALCSTLRSWP